MKFSKSELAWYGGFFVGMPSTYLGLEALALEPHLLRLVIAGCVGIGLGWMASTLVKRKSDGGPPRRE